MATKKQKRQQGLERRDEYLADLKRTNAEVLAKVRHQRFEELKRAWQENHDKNHSPKKRIPECPICQVEAATKQDPGQLERVRSELTHIVKEIMSYGG